MKADSSNRLQRCFARTKICSSQIEVRSSNLLPWVRTHALGSSLFHDLHQASAVRIGSSKQPLCVIA
jgi:hypothetical protein